ncbi:MAG: outer membrane protein [Beijerinckiaceae bacterium]
MKKTAVASGLLLASMMTAFAADLPTRSAPVYVPPPPPPPMWTGPYAGLFGGGVFDNGGGNSISGKSIYCYGGFCDGFQNGNSNFGYVRGGASSDNSFAFGGQIGYNYQIEQNFLIGGVVDFTWLNRSGSRSYSPTPVTVGIETASIYYSDTFAQDWLATARVRAGVTLDNLLIYATGGLAWGNLDSKSTVYSSSINTSQQEQLLYSGYGSGSSTAFGWAAGAGLEWRFAPNWTLFAEYLYYSLEDSYNVRVTGPFVNDATYRVNVDGSGSLIKVGVNYLFWAPPPPAPYVAPVVSVRN